MTIRIAFKRICYGLAGLSVGIVLYILTGYPQKWKDVKMGMNEERVHQICGPPANPASWDVKGHFTIKRIALDSGDFSQPRAKVRRLDIRECS